MRIHAFFIASLVAASTLLAQEDMKTWSKVKTISINTKGMGLTGTVTNVPVLVRLNASNAADIFAATLPGGADVRITNATGVAVPFEIDEWDAVGQQAAIWVRAASVAANDSSVNLRIYWGKAGVASASNGPGVFAADEGYVGAWHLGNGAGDARPASVTGAPTGYVRNGGGASAVAGVIGRADALSGSGGSVDPSAGVYLDFGRNATFQNNDYAGFADFSTGFSYSIWVNISAHTQYARLMNFSVDSANAAGDSELPSRVIMMLRHNGSDPSNFALRSAGMVYSGNSENNIAGSGSSYELSEWTHFFVTKQGGGSGAFNVYRNGALFGSTGEVEDIAYALRNAFWIGRAGNGNGWLQGMVDEVTLAKAARSPDFVKLSYETQKAGATAVVLGATGDATSVRGGAARATASFSAKAQGAGALFRIAESAQATVSVTDVRGQTVWSGSFANGARELSWDGANASSGLYVARLTVLDAQGRASSVDRRLTLAR